ncbi:putative ulp1 protease family protein [Erysiphe neolycopersici]|uniref:Putative ulp1 protease family protein n=1 Tax=Erysiphe neolycopersici TaxID=212602 RepID=A0A420I1J8_9PEZI|nr:putative ulp1 protease family protein [Erysiphe neolycopersici]
MYKEEDSSPRQETYHHRGEEVIEIHSANNSDHERNQNSSDELAQTIEEPEQTEGSLLAGSEEVKVTRSLYSAITKSFNASPDLDRALELVPKLVFSQHFA